MNMHTMPHLQDTYLHPRQISGHALARGHKHAIDEDELERQLAAGVNGHGHAGLLLLQSGSRDENRVDKRSACVDVGLGHHVRPAAGSGSVGGDGRRRAHESHQGVNDGVGGYHNIAIVANGDQKVNRLKVAMRSENKPTHTTSEPGSQRCTSKDCWS